MSRATIRDQPLWAVLVADTHDGFGDGILIYVQAALGTWYSVGEDAYITETEFQHMREDNPSWTWAIHNGAA